MTELSVDFPDHLLGERLVEEVLQTAGDLGLHLALITTLASFPGSTHWHFKMLGQKGVLELTWWPNERRLWFKVAKNRHAPWIEVALPKFASLLEHDLTQ